MMTRYFLFLALCTIGVYAIWWWFAGFIIAFIMTGVFLIVLALVEAFVAIDDIRSDSSDWWDY